MGFRDVISHHYFYIDAEEVWWVLENELEPLLSVVKKIKQEI